MRKYPEEGTFVIVVRQGKRVSISQQVRLAFYDTYDYQWIDADTLEELTSVVGWIDYQPALNKPRKRYMRYHRV